MSALTAIEKKVYFCSMKTGELTDYLDSIFHPEYQEDYDNSGFLVGRRSDECSGALVALDMTSEVLREAQELGYNMVVTHHPLIFRGVKRMTDASADGRLLLDIVQSGVSVYAAHTNLDNLPWGVSGELAARLGLRDCKVLSAKPLTDSEGRIGAGMVGTLPEAMTAEAFLLKVKEILSIPVIRTSHLGPRAAEAVVRRVALCGGSGAEFTDDAIAAGADIYLTADLKYHDFQHTDGHMLLADIGHYESEQFAKEIIFRAISEKFSNFACRISERQHGIVSYI